MKVYLALFLLLMINPFASAHACDDPNLQAQRFVDAWNERTRTVSVKTWELKRYDGSGAIRQIVESGLLLRVAVNESGCLVKAELMSRRKGNEQPDGMAALFGWLSLVAATNPTLSPGDRKAVLDKLGMSTPTAGGMVTVNGVIYSFVEDESTNSFSAGAARPEQSR